MAAALSSCSTWFAPPPGIGDIEPFENLPGWTLDRTAEAWPALIRSCDRIAERNERWRDVCSAARDLEEPDDESARQFFETHFIVRRLNGRNTRDGLITGYYEPLVNGSFKRDERYRFPLYRRPDDLLIVDLAKLYPELKGKAVRGRLQGNRVVPYHSRSEIDGQKNPLAGSELLYVDDPVQAFILQVQGSGRVQLPDGRQAAVGYADQNGHPYRSMGNYLIERGLMKREEITLPRILDWIGNNPAETEKILNSNPSFVFFQLRDPGDAGPLGSLGVPLTDERSVAVDFAFIPAGTPLWLDTTLPDGSSYRRLVLAQDTGGAIKGPVRADIFFGRGVDAARLAGEMKNPGQLYILTPRDPSPQVVSVRP